MQVPLVAPIQECCSSAQRVDSKTLVIKVPRGIQSLQRVKILQYAVGVGNFQAQKTQMGFQHIEHSQWPRGQAVELRLECRPILPVQVKAKPDFHSIPLVTRVTLVHRLNSLRS